MRQSRLMSLVEALANVVVGYGVAVLVQIVALPGVRDRDRPGAEPRDRPRLHRRLDRPKLHAAQDIRDAKDGAFWPSGRNSYGQPRDPSRASHSDSPR